MVKPEKDRIVLHSTTVDISGRGISIIGDSGAGKSSLAIKLIAMGAKLVSDDMTSMEIVGEKILLTRPKEVPLAIEARGIGLLSVPLIKGSELFYFVKLGQHSMERLPLECNKFCLGKPIRLIHFNPRSGNTSALFLMLKHGLLDSMKLGK